MITLLTSELNRINQEINKRMERHRKQSNKLGIKFFDDSKWDDTIELEKEKETLKKVSLMWADGFEEIIDKFRHMVAEDGFRRLQGEKPKLAWSDLFDYFHNELKLKEIKSLMEKA
jgi:hypothetical protein